MIVSVSYSTVTPDGVSLWELLLGNPSDLNYNYGVDIICRLESYPLLNASNPSTLSSVESEFPPGYVIIAYDPYTHIVLFYSVVDIPGDYYVAAVELFNISGIHGVKLTLEVNNEKRVISYVYLPHSMNVTSPLQSVSAAVAYWLPTLNTTSVYRLFASLAEPDACATIDFGAVWTNETGTYDLEVNVTTSQNDNYTVVKGVYTASPVIAAEYYSVFLKLNDTQLELVGGRLYNYTGLLRVTVEVWLNTGQ